MNKKPISHSLISNKDDDDIDDFLKSLDEEDGKYNFKMFRKILLKKNIFFFHIFHIFFQLSKLDQLVLYQIIKVV